MTPTSAERGRDVRDRLLRAAAELIPELGWGNVTTRAIAQRAEVTAGLIHYHFRSVHDLLSEAALSTAREVVTAPLACVTRAPDVSTGLDRLLTALDAYDGTDPTSLLLIETYLAASRDEDLRSRLTALIDHFRSELAAWLREHGHGESSAATAAVLSAALDGVLLHRSLDATLDAAAVGPVLRRLVNPGADEVPLAHRAPTSDR